MQKVKALFHTYRLEFSVIFINLRARLCNSLGTQLFLLGENRNNSKVVQNCYLRKKYKMVCSHNFEEEKNLYTHTY